ncbi:MAG: glycosyltransferase family 2 protein [Eubacteriales bacterium]|nr:glycosyltransferase family 2 protein [Eubacteriales bacterium]
MVDILLASYNGERFIREQLDSLLNQTEKGIRIIVRDDGSTDGTGNILEEYRLRHADKIELVGDRSASGSPARNFMELLKYSKSEYIMFCDQDDVWDPEKVHKMLVRMQAEEKRCRDGAEPILVFSDYEVVDANLKPLPIREDSLQVAKYYHTFNRLLVQNYVTGCTMMINRTAALLAGEYDSRMLMHDWWIALYVSAMGTVVHMPEKLMKYRQHGRNDVGATDVRSMKYRLKKLADRKVSRSKDTYYAQAELLKERYTDALPERIQRTLDEFLKIRTLAKPARMKALVAGGYLKSDLVRTMGQLFYI